MRRISALVDHEITCTQPKAFKPEYELRFGDELVATLRFPKLLRNLALAESGDGSWTFEPAGVWRAKTVIREGGAGTELGVFTRNMWKGEGTLDLPNGRQFTLAANFWKSAFEFRTKEGEILLQLKKRGLFRLEATLQMYRRALQVPELPWMVMLALYLAVMAKRGRRKHASLG